MRAAQRNSVGWSEGGEHGETGGGRCLETRDRVSTCVDQTARHPLLRATQQRSLMARRAASDGWPADFTGADPAVSPEGGRAGEGKEDGSGSAIARRSPRGRSGTCWAEPATRHRDCWLPLSVRLSHEELCGPRKDCGRLCRWCRVRRPARLLVAGWDRRPRGRPPPPGGLTAAQ